MYYIYAEGNTELDTRANRTEVETLIAELLEDGFLENDITVVEGVDVKFTVVPIPVLPTMKPSVQLQ